MSHSAKYKEEFLHKSPRGMGYFQKIVKELPVTGKGQD